MVFSPERVKGKKPRDRTDFTSEPRCCGYDPKRVDIYTGIHLLLPGNLKEKDVVQECIKEINDNLLGEEHYIIDD